MMIMLQHTKVQKVTTESIMRGYTDACRVAIDALEATVLASYGITMPTMFDKSSDATTSSHVYPIPAAKTYKEWSNATVGLRDKVRVELNNAVKTVSQRIADAQLTPACAMVMSTLLNNSLLHWTVVGQFVDNQINTMMRQYNLTEDERGLEPGGEE